MIFVTAEHSFLSAGQPRQAYALDEFYPHTQKEIGGSTRTMSGNDLTSEHYRRSLHRRASCSRSPTVGNPRNTSQCGKFTASSRFGMALWALTSPQQASHIGKDSIRSQPRVLRHLSRRHPATYTGWKNNISQDDKQALPSILEYLKETTCSFDMRTISWVTYYLFGHHYIATGVKAKIKMLMANASSVSITTDAASMHTGDSYVAVTAHWLDPQWNMMSCVLGVSMSNGHKSLSWLNPADKNRIVQQLKTEMINVLGVNPATAEEDGSEEAEPPAKSQRVLLKRKISTYSLAKRKMKV
ncbi:hypothetical protein EMCRGX_G023113 [Ephydatia muelleri]